MCESLIQTLQEILLYCDYSYSFLSGVSQVAQKAQETESILTADVSPFSSQSKGNLDRRKSSRPLSEGTTGDDKSAKLDTIEGMKVDL